MSNRGITQFALTLIFGLRCAGGKATVGSLRKQFGGWAPTNGELEAAIEMLRDQGAIRVSGAKEFGSLWFSDVILEVVNVYK